MDTVDCWTFVHSLFYHKVIFIIISIISDTTNSRIYLLIRICFFFCFFFKKIKICSLEASRSRMCELWLEGKRNFGQEKTAGMTSRFFGGFFDGTLGDALAVRDGSTQSCIPFGCVCFPIPLRAFWVRVGGRRERARIRRRLCLRRRRLSE